MLEFTVQQVYFDDIVNGRKNIEGRLAKGKYLNLSVGEKVKFSNNAGTQHVVKEVVATYQYASFEAAFKEQDYRKAVPGAKNTSDAIAVYEQFYPKQAQLKAGVVFIEVK